MLRQPLPKYFTTAMMCPDCILYSRPINIVRLESVVWKPSLLLVLAW